MKNFLFGTLIAVSAIFISCDKDDDLPNNNPTTVAIKYDFTSTVPAEYFFVFKRDTAITDDSVVTQSLTRTYNAPVSSTQKIAQFQVYPPEDWVGTTTQATINMKISVNGVVKKDTTGIMAGVDRATGITVTTTY